jgi:hypothetical protein
MILPPCVIDFRTRFSGPKTVLLAEQLRLLGVSTHHVYLS